MLILLLAICIKGQEPSYITSRKLILTDIKGVLKQEKGWDIAGTPDAYLNITAGGTKKQLGEKSDTFTPQWTGDFIWEGISLEGIKNVKFELEEIDLFIDEAIGTCTKDFSSYQQTSEERQDVSFECGDITLSMGVVVLVTLVPCEERLIEEAVVEPSPCHSSLDTVYCYKQLDGVSCGTGCPANSSGNGETGTCELLCAYRTVGKSASWPCMKGCYLDTGSGERKCTNECTGLGYVPNQKTGICTFACATFITNESCVANNACLVNEITKADGSMLCGEACTYPNLFRNDSGYCTHRVCDDIVVKSCKERADCVVTEGHCTDRCATPAYYDITTDSCEEHGKSKSSKANAAAVVVPVVVSVVVVAVIAAVVVVIVVRRRRMRGKDGETGGGEREASLGTGTEAQGGTGEEMTSGVDASAAE